MGHKVWYKVDDPFWMLVAEPYLSCTTRVVVERVLPQLMKEYKGYRALYSADPDYIWQLTRETGLKKRGSGQTSQKKSVHISNESVKQITTKLTERTSSLSVQMLHQGILHVSWFSCKGILCCEGCSIFHYCILQTDKLKEDHLGVH